MDPFPYIVRCRNLYAQHTDISAVMKLSNQKGTQIKGNYSSNGDIASSITPFGKGWVGAVGPHPEADKSWCKTPVQLILNITLTLW